MSEKYDELAGLFKILSHPKRLCILKALEQKELSVHELQQIACCRQANVSQHLSQLRKAHFVKKTKIGKSVYYSRNEEIVGKVNRSII